MMPDQQIPTHCPKCQKPESLYVVMCPDCWEQIQQHVDWIKAETAQACAAHVEEILQQCTDLPDWHLVRQIPQAIRQRCEEEDIA